MLIIRHLTGPMAGKEERVDPSLDRVAFGRRLDCQVIYPPEETIVAREHFALVRRPPGPSGHWTIDLFGEPFVAVNGVPADPGQTLPPQATFELGKRGGPSFKVEVLPDEAGDNLPLTIPQEEPERPRVLAVKAGKVARYARQLAVFGSVIAVAAVGAGGYYAYQESQLRISADVRAHVARAAFLVLRSRRESGGTAWPVGPRLLATNTHVAEQIKELNPGESMLVRSSGPNGRTYRVVGYQVHPGYAAFEALLLQFSQDRIQQLKYNLGIRGYDVALLRVNEDLPADSILELAPPDELRALASGSVVATAGYPTEGMSGGEAQSSGATPELHVGNVTSVTDFFHLPADFEHSQLVHHDLPSTGGASGSPIVGRSGRVVAVHSAGSLYFPKDQGVPTQERVPSGVLINYGQRVDLLRELMAGNSDRELAEARKYWSQQLAKLSSGAEIVATYIQSWIRDADKRPVDLDCRNKQTAVLSDRPAPQERRDWRRQGLYEITVPDNDEYLFSSYSHDGSATELTVWLKDRKICEDKNENLVIHSCRVKGLAKSSVRAWVTSKYDSDTTITWQFCKVTTARS